MPDSSPKTPCDRLPSRRGRPPERRCLTGRWLPFPVDYSLPMRLLQRVRDLDPESQRLLERQRTSDEPLGQRLPLQVLYDEVFEAVLVAHVVERTDVRVRELRDRLSLPLEPLPHLGGGRQVRRQH